MREGRYLNENDGEPIPLKLRVFDCLIQKVVPKYVNGDDEVTIEGLESQRIGFVDKW